MVNNIIKLRAKTLSRVIIISKLHIEKSSILKQNEKIGFISIADYSQGVIDIGLKNCELKNSQLQNIEFEVLNYWNSSVNMEIEEFWSKLEDENILIGREDILGKIIDTKRFKNVEQSIDIYNNFKNIKINKTPLKAFDIRLNILLDIIQNDNNNKIKILQKCLRLKRVSNSNYLKFGESMAYVSRTNQMKNIFKEEDEKVLYKMWLNND